MDNERAADDYVEIDPAELSGVFRAPDWLRDAGIMSWLLVGIALLAVSLVALLAATQTIVIPVITASIVAAVASPVVVLVAVSRRSACDRGGVHAARDHRRRDRDVPHGLQRDHRRDL